MTVYGRKWYYIEYVEKRKEDIMDKLYSSIEINKVLEDFKEVIKYYITKEDTYGFKITKQESTDLVEREVLSIKNVLDTEDKIKSLIDKIIKCEEDFNQAKYIVEDYTKLQLNA